MQILKRKTSMMGWACAVMAAAGLLSPTAAHAGWDWASGPSIYDGEGEDAKDWSVEVIPYLWLASLGGEVALPPGVINIDASFGDLASNLQGGFAGVLDVRYRRWHLISDNSWVSLGVTQEINTPGGPVIESASAKIDLSVAFGTMAVAYELPLKRSFAVDLYLGARWWHVTNDTTITVTPGGPGTPTTNAGGLTETWADFVAGVRWRNQLTKKWRLFASADVGGGQASIDWSVNGGVGYDFNRYVGMSASWRALGVDYSNAGFRYNVMQQGLLLGLNLRY